MLDIKLLQNEFDNVAEKLRKKKVDEETLMKLKKISLCLKDEKKILENLNSKKNSKSKLFGTFKKMA